MPISTSKNKNRTQRKTCEPIRQIEVPQPIVETNNEDIEKIKSEYENKMVDMIIKMENLKQSYQDYVKHLKEHYRETDVIKEQIFEKQKEEYERQVKLLSDGLDNIEKKMKQSEPLPLSKPKLVRQNGEYKTMIYPKKKNDTIKGKKPKWK